MCDTLYKKLSNGIIFGKNSDRSPNEPNLTIFYPRKKANENQLECTYITIEEVQETNAIVLVQPSWMWGGEMGINEKGVVIGNEAVFTKSKGKKINKLLGMDLLRLGLERGNSAKDALDVMISLLEKYGQGGNGGFDKNFFYDNSYLIADKNEAYVLETVANKWVTFRIDDNYNISNRLSLNANYFSCTNEKDNFAKRNSDFLFTHFSRSKNRQDEAHELLQDEEFNLLKMMEALRHHHLKDEDNLYSKGSVKSVCMHKSTLGDHTTASLIFVSHDKFNTIWLTGSSTPCLSIYKPTYFLETIPPVFINKEESYKYWLERELLIRAIYGGLIDDVDYKNKAKEIQKKFVKEEEELIRNNPTEKELHEFSLKCSKIEQEFINQYQKEINKIKEKEVKLPKLWVKYTNHLGINVFERELSKRIKY